MRLTACLQLPNTFYEYSQPQRNVGRCNIRDKVLRRYPLATCEGRDGSNFALNSVTIQKVDFSTDSKRVRPKARTDGAHANYVDVTPK